MEAGLSDEKLRVHLAEAMLRLQMLMCKDGPRHGGAGPNHLDLNAITVARR